MVEKLDEVDLLDHEDRDVRLYPGQTARLLSKPGLRFDGFVASSKEGMAFPEDAAVALGATEALVDAERIEFRKILLGQVGFESLISNPHFSGVRELALLHCDWRPEADPQHLGSRIGFGLAESHFTGLEVLHLTSLRIGDEAAIAMVNSPVFGNVKHVCLSQINLTDSFVEPLIESPWWNQLTTLYVRATRTQASAQLLFDAPEPENLKRICFSGWEDREAAEKLLNERYGTRYARGWGWWEAYESGFDYVALEKRKQQRLAEWQANQNAF